MIKLPKLFRPRRPLWTPQRLIPGVVAGAAASESPPAYVGPLDLVSLTAKFPFGVRALSAAMLGQNLFRLSRDSDDAEMDFTADAVTGRPDSAAIVAWRDAAGAATAYLVTLYGQGVAFNLTVATGQWEWVENAQGGRCGFVYANSGSPTNSSAEITFTTGAASVAAVSKIHCTISMSDSGGDGNYFSTQLRDSGVMDFEDADPIYYAYAEFSTSQSDFVVWSQICGSTTRSVKANGVAISLSTDLTDGTPSEAVFTGDQVIELGIGGYFCECAVWDGEMSGAEALAVQSNQETEYTL